ncbi:MAG: condensation domain-containing protein [Kibdelosporangium sp.]
MGEASAWCAATGNEESLWLLEKFVPGSGVNNVAFAFNVRGTLRRDVLNSALRYVVGQHPALRTRFRVAESRLVKALVADSDIELEELDVLQEFVARPFPLDGGPLLRGAIQSGPDGDVVCLVAHHLIFDAISAFLLGQALAVAYDAILEHGRPPQGVPRVSHPATGRPSDFWRNHLAGFDPAGLALNIDTRVSARWTLAGAEATHELGPETAGVIKRLRKELRAPDGVVLLAAYYVLLAAHGAGPDLVVGCPFTTRDESSARAIGFHVNVLPLRTFVDPAATFRTLARAVRNAFLEAMENTAVDVDGVLPQVRRSHASWRDPIFRHVFNYVPVGSDMTFQIGGAQAAPVPIAAQYSKFDLEFFLLASPDRLRLRAVYSTEVHSADDVAELLGRYEELLLALAADVDRPVSEVRWWMHRPTDVPKDPVVEPAVVVAPLDDELVGRFVLLWRQILNRDDLGADSNFFASGGQSLLAALLTQRAEETAGVPITLAEFFAHATPAALAGHVRAVEAERAA